MMLGFDAIVVASTNSQSPSLQTGCEDRQSVAKTEADFETWTEVVRPRCQLDHFFGAAMVFLSSSSLLLLAFACATA